MVKPAKRIWEERTSDAASPHNLRISSPPVKPDTRYNQRKIRDKAFIESLITVYTLLSSFATLQQSFVSKYENLLQNNEKNRFTLCP
ncbi:hypothetical protein OZX62_07690 [Bifidobacterium sp. ESL0690]|uniref:hypothetical protein n=1 Tax=Bifidobacterium sp. ESL0690 TaxID=2983214 RepID=UPI0023F741F9|nr:hypothetical protein [Bifidobacterium sp. ESL0690]WEV46318.1 hypothetical protein OZX62_07690 [Bifidobacterium sp. ESL0690]